MISSWAGSGQHRIVRTFHSDRVVGNGSFGVVFMATVSRSRGGGSRASLRERPGRPALARCFLRATPAPRPAAVPRDGPEGGD